MKTTNSLYQSTCQCLDKWRTKSFFFLCELGTSLATRLIYKYVCHFLFTYYYYFLFIYILLSDSMFR